MTGVSHPQWITLSCAEKCNHKKECVISAMGPHFDQNCRINIFNAVDSQHIQLMKGFIGQRVPVVVVLNESLPIAQVRDGEILHLDSSKP